ncbi:hypothetical protein SAMN02745673_03521 [Marinactinospora thermotolerans DSM 45154]|uniref:Lipoprotein n=2 Tax=Marinactinospora thermotolerans TaxID=531310 RepID=A0A1T4SG21_9ACTN|nr:hypothetical protein SAMN02745673_03521 [Marinactinospora thermotolerans DSM 45154]
MAPAETTRQRPRGPFVTVAAAAALTFGAAGCAIDLSHWRPGAEEEASPSPTPVEAAPLLESALDQLAEAPAVRLQGQFADSDGQPRESTLLVADSGATSGTVDVDGTEVQVTQVDGRMFLSADDSYWLTQSLYDNPDSDSYAEHWVQVRPEVLGIDPQTVLAPAELAEILRAQAPDGGTATEEKLDGNPVYRIDLANGKMWLDKEAPHDLLRMEITDLAPTEGEAPAIRTAFNLSQPDQADLETFYDDLIALTEDDLTSARDSRLIVQWEGELSLDCETGGACSVSGTVTDMSDSDSGTVLVRMDATMNNAELGEKKCNDSAALEAGGTVDLSCGVDYALAPSANPQSYEIEGEALLSTRALSGSAAEELPAKLKDQREATLAKVDGGAGQSPEASASPSGN